MKLGGLGLLGLLVVVSCSPAPPTRGEAGAGGSVGSGGGGASGGSTGGVGSGGLGGGTGGVASGGVSGSGVGGSIPFGGGGAGGSAGAGGGAVCPALFACDNFDAAAALDTAKWNSIGNTAPTVVDGGANSSARAMTVASPDTVGSFISPKTGLPPAGGSFYIRARAKFANATSATSGHNWYIVGADAPSNGGELRLGVSQCPGKTSYMMDLNLLPSGGQEFSAFSNGFVTGDNPADYPDMGFTWQGNTWYCVEAHFGNGEFQVWVDGVEVPNMHVTDWNGRLATWSVTYNVGKIGGQGNGNLGQVWWDDVAYSLERIGCDCACQ